MSAHNKRLNYIFATGVMSLSMLFATQASAGTLIGSKHDFSTTTWTTEICTVCHTPHNGNNATNSNTPLWGHATTQSTFTMYTGIINAAGGKSFQATAGTVPTGTSLMCMSCHDGTVALDSFGGNTGATKMTNPGTRGASNNPMLGADLSNDHPISFVYDTTLAGIDGSLNDPAAINVTIEAGPKGTKTGLIKDLLLDNNKVECSSCHDVHNTFTGTQPMMLKVSMAKSALCLACHNK